MNATITQNAVVKNGVALDRMVEIGPRGGQTVMWRAAKKRDYQVALWHWTQSAAARA